LGQRIFDIKLQDDVVSKDFDILAEANEPARQTAGKPDKAVIRQFEGIRVRNVLVLELVPKSADPQDDQAPIINFIEVIREDAGETAEIDKNNM
jgi:hypothetical protein